VSEGEENITHRARKRISHTERGRGEYHTVSKGEENITHRARKRRVSHSEQGRGEYHTQSEEENITHRARKSEEEENITHRVRKGEYHTQSEEEENITHRARKRRASQRVRERRASQRVRERRISHTEQAWYKGGMSIIHRGTTMHLCHDTLTGFTSRMRLDLATTAFSAPTRELAVSICQT